MSIMYEALQKTQPENDVQAIVTLQNNMTLDDWIDVIIALIIAMLLAAIIVAHYPRFNNTNMAASQLNTVVLEVPDETIDPKTLSVPSQPIEPVASNSPLVLPFGDTEYESKHILNGVFVSDEEKIAMINNRFFNIGDTVDGMKIISIEPDKIKLQNDIGMLELKIVV